MSNKTINEKELEKLLETLSRRKNASQDNLTKAEVFKILEEAGLLEVYEEGDLANLFIQKQKKKSKLSRIVTAVSAIVFSPLLVFGGYKAKEIALTFDNSTTTTINNYESITQNLKQENSDLEAQLKEIKEQDEKNQQRITQLTDRIADIQAGRAATSSSSVLSAEPGSILKPGETWVQDGMEMKVSEVSFKPGCDKAFVQFDISITNKSGADLATNIVGANFYVTVDGKSYSNFSWTTNLAARSNCSTSYNYPDRFLVKSGLFSIPELKSEQKVEYYLLFWENIYDLNQEIVFHVKEAGNIKSAKWRLNPEAN